MWLRIVDIDLDAPRIHVEVAPDDSDECLSHLEAFVSQCAEEGIADIRLYHRRGTSKRNMSRLEDFAATKRLRPPALHPPRLPGGNGGYGRLRSELVPRSPRSGSARPPMRYRIFVDDLARSIDSLHTMTALVCACEDLDPRSTLLLRLCVYELASNSVEHGTFTAGPPCIHLHLLFSENRVFVEYCDNSDAFSTTGPFNADLVERRITAKTKRGLGLYILNRLCNDFKLERAENWNTTSFNLDMNKNCERVTKGEIHE